MTMNELDKLATRPGTMVKTNGGSARCQNEHMIVEGRVKVGDSVACEYCTGGHRVLGAIPIDIAETVER